MLQSCGMLPSRARLQDMIVATVRGINYAPDRWDRDLQKLARQLLLMEVRLADLAKDAELSVTELPTDSLEVLANPNNWQYGQRLEISHTHQDDGPGVQFAFGREVVWAPTPDRVLALATGRYWTCRNGASRQYEDRLELSTDTSYFLSGRGLAFPEAVREDIRRKLKDLLAVILIS